MADQTSNATRDGAVLRVLRIAVGTKNPCKIEAVTKAIKQSIITVVGDSLINIDVQVEGFSVESGVPDQPFGDVSCLLLMLFLCNVIG